ncbi:uncharacterized protein LOC133204181 [Saccostrea echinata]|uniref:uncharacterized protein LOC133204181 n=1 Tax=Saccostrea echinata TaxID=191078 RepID=UPI002A83462F|nr:uncharacterized protein LOC133204181 [Saccostrea echinata]
MNFRKVVLIYVLIFAWFMVYHLVFSQTEITYNVGPQLTVGPMGETYYYPPLMSNYYQPTMFNGSGGSGDLVGIGLVGYLLYTLLKFLIPILLISAVGQSSRDKAD